jgi:hypothetical protein
MHDYAEMRRGIHELMTGFDPVPDARTTADFGWSDAERLAAAERLGLDDPQRLVYTPRQSS